MSQDTSKEQEFPDCIEFQDGAIKFKYKGADYVVERPSALESVRYNKQIKTIDTEDLEAMVTFYQEILIKHGLPEAIAKKLDMFLLGDVFRAVNSPATKKK